MVNEMRETRKKTPRVTFDEVIQEFYASSKIPTPGHVQKFVELYPQYAVDIIDFAATWMESKESELECDEDDSEVDLVVNRTMSHIQNMQFNDELEHDSICKEKLSTDSVSDKSLQPIEIKADTSDGKKHSHHRKLKACLTEIPSSAELSISKNSVSEFSKGSFNIATVVFSNKPGEKRSSELPGYSLAPDKKKTNVSKNREANDSFKRAVLATEIVSRWHTNAKFGSVKLQKALYLCEKHLSFSEVQGNYYRHAAGPHDNTLMRSVTSQMKKAKWYEAKKDGQRTVFIPLEKAGSHKTYFGRYWADNSGEFDILISKLTNMDTEQTEIVATLYAAWNDFMIDGKDPADEEIVTEVLDRWHDSKRRINQNRWKEALLWMKKNALVPKGQGAKTIIPV